MTSTLRTRPTTRPLLSSRAEPALVRRPSLGDHFRTGVRSAASFTYVFFLKISKARLIRWIEPSAFLLAALFALPLLYFRVSLVWIFFDIWLLAQVRDDSLITPSCVCLSK